MRLYSKLCFLFATLSCGNKIKVDFIELGNDIAGSMAGLTTVSSGNLVFKNFLGDGKQFQKISASLGVALINTAVAFTFHILVPKTLFFAAVAYFSVVGLGFILEMTFKQVDGNFKLFAFELPWYEVLRKHAFLGISTFFSFSGAFLCPKLFSTLYWPFLLGFVILSILLYPGLERTDRPTEGGFTEELNKRNSIIKFELSFAVLYALVPLKDFVPLAFALFVFVTQFAKNYSSYFYENKALPIYILCQSVFWILMALLILLLSKPFICIELLVLLMRILVFL